MKTIDDLCALPPFGVAQGEKQALFHPMFQALHRHHQSNCPPYATMLKALPPFDDSGPLADFPFIPVGLFKRNALHSMGQAAGNGHTIHSSGTSGQQTAQILLDGETAALQRQALAAITGQALGQARLPMLVLDSPAVVRPPLSASARGAGVSGFSVCATRRVFALREDMSLDADAVDAFLAQYGAQPFFLFGFTYLVWAHFCQPLAQAGDGRDFSNGILIHGGGWKALQNQAVSRAQFHQTLADSCKLTRIHDYYGMAEQAGSIFLECPHGHLHCSLFSEVFVRRPGDFSLCAVGERGILQVLSLLPRSYPGHNLMTEDEGTLLGEDDCPCGWKGRYFTIKGRLPKAELRGCSDVYSA